MPKFALFKAQQKIESLVALGVYGARNGA